MTQPAGLQSQRFAESGYLVVRGLCPEPLRRAMEQATREALDPVIAPAEYEADVGYPGAPATRSVAGGDTPRRLLHALARDGSFRQWAAGPLVADALERIGGGAMRLSQCHHNCVMTKYPGYSSATLWHQDIRYWSFDRPELISMWLALGEENERNGALRVIPGSHRLALDRGRLDAALFLRPELNDNKALIERAIPVELAPGDVLFFHCQLFHAAGRNRSDAVKLSPVFTYHGEDNHPIPDTRSALYPSVPLGVNGVPG